MIGTLSLILVSLAIFPPLSFSRLTDISELYRFPNGTWLENIAVRPNGNLLVSDSTGANLWEIVPSSQSMHISPHLVHHFNEAHDVGGIAELKPDTYAVIASNSVWKIDLGRTDNVPTPGQIAKIPAGFLNGMAPIDDGNAVVISDSQLGVVWYLNIQSGNYSVLHQHETMEANSNLGILIGINGLRVLHNQMYYSNTPKQIFCRVRIDTRTGRALGPYEIISHNTLADDFALDPLGVGYLASTRDNDIIRDYPSGHYEVIAGSKDSRILMTPTSAAFGRTQNDRDVLYVTTGGETELPVNNTTSLGGNVMAVPIKR